MTTIETLSNGESWLIHRTKINDNFTNVNNDKVETSDYTDANVKTKYENNADTNAFTDAEKTKLSSLSVGGVDSVNGEVGTVVLNQDDILDWTTFKQYSSTEKTKLAWITAWAQPNAVASVNGQTGTVVVSKSDVGLWDVDNTSDADKPVSTATQTALDWKENSFTKNTAFNKNFWTVAGTVAEWNVLSNKQDALGYSPLEDVIAWSNVTIDKTNPLKPVINASWGGWGWGAVDSVFWRTGVVTAQSWDYTTTQVTEGTNLYYTEARVSANTDVVANTAKVSADGSVTTHNDITSAWSGEIITSAERTKLNGIAAGAEVNNIASVNGNVGTVVLDTSDISDTTDARYITDAQQTVLWNTSGTNTGDQDLTGLALKSNVLELDNTTSFTPSSDFEPATKKYVDDNAWGSWGWGLRETIQIAGTQIENTILYEGAVGSATTLSNGFLTLLTAPTGASFIVGVSKSTNSGTTYWTAENITLTATNNYVKGTLSGVYAEGDFLKIEITQVGSTVAGQDLLFTVTGS